MKPTVASLKATTDEHYTIIQDHEAKISSLLETVARLEAEIASGKTRQVADPNDLKPATPRMVAALVRLGEFGEGVDPMTVDKKFCAEIFKNGWSFSTVGARLDAWRDLFKALDIEAPKSYPCHFCSAGQHSTKDEARTCAMAHAKP